MTKRNLWEEDIKDESKYYLRLGKTRYGTDRYAVIYNDDKRNWYISAIPKEMSREEIDKLKRKIIKDVEENPYRIRLIKRKGFELEEIKIK